MSSSITPSSGGGGSFESTDSDSLITESTATNQYSRDFIVGSPQIDNNGSNDDRMMFIKSLSGAFRAGRSTSANNNESNIGYYSAGFGFNTQASGLGSFAAGNDSDALGNSSIALGLSNQAVANSTTSIGHDSKAHIEGSFAMSGGAFVLDGDSQELTSVVSYYGSNGITAALRVDQDTTPSDEQYIEIPTNHSAIFKAKVIGRCIGGASGTIGDIGAYILTGVISNVSGTTTIKGTVTEEILYEDNVAWTVVAVADDANDRLNINVTGETDVVIRWTATVALTIIGG